MQKKGVSFRFEDKLGAESKIRFDEVVQLLVQTVANVTQGNLNIHFVLRDNQSR